MIGALVRPTLKAMTSSKSKSLSCDFEIASFCKSNEKKSGAVRMVELEQVSEKRKTGLAKITHEEEERWVHHRDHGKLQHRLRRSRILSASDRRGKSEDRVRESSRCSKHSSTVNLFVGSNANVLVMKSTAAELAFGNNSAKSLFFWKGRARR